MTTNTDEGNSALVGDVCNVLNYRQVCHLDNVLNETMDICGVCGLPRISVTIKDFILKLRHELNRNQFPMIDIRLNGGAAATVLDPLGTYQFNDIDILIVFDNFETEDDDVYFSDTIRLVLQVIEDMLQPMSATTANLFSSQKLSYIQKLIRIQNADNGDSWSLLSLGVNTEFGDRSRKVDIKFTKRIQRQFEFSIDSFQIVLDSLLTFYEALFTFSYSTVRITENFYPTVYIYSKWTSLSEALGHLANRLIVTTLPEKIRGGGLLKYCKLIVQGFLVPVDCNVALLERYMCSRFFIDYADFEGQQKAIEGFLRNHFHSIAGKKFLDKLYRVISCSSVCLMKNERQQVLRFINKMAIDVSKHYTSLAYDRAMFSADRDLLRPQVGGMVVVYLDDHSRWTMEAMGTCPSRSSSSWTTPTDLSPSDDDEDR